MKFLMFFCLLFAVMQTSWAQAVGTPYIGYVAKPAPPSSTMGNDFWVAFENDLNMTYSSVYLALNIAAQLPTTVTISFTANNDTFTYALAAGVSTRIDLSQMKTGATTFTTTGNGDERAIVYLDTTAGLFNKTMHITSTQPVAVYAFDTYSAATDATVVYPIASWGTDYYQISYQPLNTTTFPNYGVSNEIIIANQDKTIITLSDNTTRTLNKGDIYVTNSGIADITGRHLSSTVPVSYFAGSQGFYVPNSIQAADVLFEQMSPDKVWDKQYFVPNVPQFTDPSVTTNDRIRVVASQNGTEVTYQGASLPATTPAGSTTTGNTVIGNGGKQTLNAGQWVELVINSSTNTGGAFITANNPIGVAGYMVGGSSSTTPISSGNTGDPDHAIMPGLNQMIQQVTISPFMFTIGSNLAYTNFDDNNSVIHGAIILTKKENKGSVIMTKGSDPTNLLTGTWIDDTNGSGMSSYYYVFDNTADLGSSFTISSLVNGGGLLVLCYGLAWYESYYYNAGSGAYSLQ